MHPLLHTERSVTFKFFQSTKDSSKDNASNRTIVFVSKKQRDQFVDLVSSNWLLRRFSLTSRYYSLEYASLILCSTAAF